MDGSVPIVLRGDLKTWKANRELKGSPYFTIAEPLDSTSMAVRSNSSKNMQNIIGVFDQSAVPKTIFNRELLQKQVDGILIRTVYCFIQWMVKKLCMYIVTATNS